MLNVFQLDRNYFMTQKLIKNNPVATHFFHHLFIYTILELGVKKLIL